MRAAARIVAGALLATCALGADPARAEVRRFALLVGANRGYAHETPLRYAESDVDAVATVLARHGGFAGERILRLQAPTAARARAALVDLNLAIQNDVRAGNEAVLFVYYSGHADGQNLHLGTSDLPYDEWSKLVRLSAARLKVLLVDACRSGALTRVKGGRQVAPFQIGVNDQLRNEGFAIVTSSSAGEDAQESDALRGSIFTHHFLTALRGPGDANRDRQVTLAEAYAYAYEHALKTSMGSLAGAQHATFDYDLRGRMDPVLADLRAVGELAQLVLATPGQYLLTAGDSDAIFVEAAVKSAQTVLVVPAAGYRVRLRTRRSVHEGEVAARAGASVTVGEDSLRAMPLAQVVRKGETETVLAHGPSAGGLVHGPLGAGFSPMLGAQAAWAFELPRLTLVPRLGLATGRALRPGAGVSGHTLTELSLELSALYAFDFGRLALAPLVSVGWSLLRDRVRLDAACMLASCRYTASPQALVTSVGAFAAWSLGRGFSLESTVELVNFYVRRQASRQQVEPDAPSFGTLTYRAGLGLGYRY